jgi:hypothetical protein
VSATPLADTSRPTTSLESEAASVQEAGLRVIVVSHDFEDEEPLPVGVVGKLEREAILVVQLRPVDAGVPQLLDLRRVKIPVPELLQDLLVLAIHVACVEVPQEQGFHHVCVLRCMRACSTEGLPVTYAKN